MDAANAAVGGIRVACPPDYALTLQRSPDDIPLVAPNSLVGVAAAAVGGSFGAHAFNAFTGGVSSGGGGQNLSNLTHGGHSTTRV